ncbi:MAG: GGDEF domain-containing protein [Bryobacterales bacterium]|nr:GGDEF domain-containing protein [Bryobacterales bacterium]
MRLILTRGIASLDELATALGHSATALDVVVADDPSSIQGQIAEGDLNVVLIPASGDLAAMRLALSAASPEERPMVLVVDSRSKEGRGSLGGCHPGDCASLAEAPQDVGDLPTRPMDWLEDGGDAEPACPQPTSRDGDMNLRQWVDALSKVTEGAVLRAENGRCVALDASFPAKMGFRPLLQEGARLGIGFVKADRRLLLEWLGDSGGKSRSSVIPFRGAQAADQLVVTMRGSHGEHPVMIERIPCTGVPASSRILLVSQAQEVEAAQLAAPALGELCDPDTGLAGLEAFLETVRLAVSRGRREGQGCAVLVCRLDGMDRIDRKLGAEAAATALQTAATRLRRAGGDVESMARVGPYEFGFVFVSSDALSVIEQQILRFQCAIRPPLTSGDHPLSATLRFGMSEASPTFQRPRALVRLARSKAATALLLGHALQRTPARTEDKSGARGVPLEREIERACRQQEFELVLQPIIDLRTFQVRGAEVLVRWRHPARGLLAPAHFLPMAESTGQVSQIGQWVLGEVCAKASHWARLFQERARFAVNVSPVELHDNRFLATTLGILGQHTLGNADVELEITETAVLASERKTAEVVECLRRQGVRVALDDFGVGYSSLAHLREIPFSKLKIDRTFVHGSTASHRCRTIVRSMVELGRGLRVEVNAEGVEIAEQLRFLYEAGCDEVQGYLFARPMPPHRFESWVAGYQGQTLAAFGATQAADDTAKIVPFARGRQQS